MIDEKLNLINKILIIFKTPKKTVIQDQKNKKVMLRALKQSDDNQ